MSGLVLSENTKKTLFAVVVIIALGLRWTFFYIHYQSSRNGCNSDLIKSLL